LTFSAARYHLPKRLIRLASFEGRKIRYIASDEVSPNKVAIFLGEAIGKLDLKWLVISDEKMLNGMTASGINPKIAKGLVEMNAGRRNEILYED
jgi:hypothetical protein